MFSRARCLPCGLDRVVRFASRLAVAHTLATPIAIEACCKADPCRSAHARSVSSDDFEPDDADEQVCSGMRPGGWFIPGRPRPRPLHVGALELPCWREATARVFWFTREPAARWPPGLRQDARQGAQEGAGRAGEAHRGRCDARGSQEVARRPARAPGGAHWQGRAPEAAHSLPGGRYSPPGRQEAPRGGEVGQRPPCVSQEVATLAYRLDRSVGPEPYSGCSAFRLDCHAVSVVHIGDKAPPYVRDRKDYLHN